jgi:hypothetical protein
MLKKVSYRLPFITTQLPKTGIGYKAPNDPSFLLNVIRNLQVELYTTINELEYAKTQLREVYQNKHVLDEALDHISDVLAQMNAHSVSASLCDADQFQSVTA